MVQVHILAEDFVNNDFYNTKDGLEGCPLSRALFRAGLEWDVIYEYPQVDKAHSRILNMFDKDEPIESFTIEIPINQ